MDSSKASGKLDYQRGMTVYAAHCGQCHDTGNVGAPTLDDVDEWDDRSLQWSAVLNDHAKRGFIKMPANAALSERQVREALYYMAVTIDANDE